MNETTKRIAATFDLVLTAFFIALMIVGARVNLALGPIPLTLQTLVVVCGGILLGSRQGALVPAIYLVMGLVGLPVFTSGGGLGYVFKPSFGFLLGFIPGAWLAGLLGNIRLINKPRLRVFLGSATGILLIYLVGFSYLPMASRFTGSLTAVWAVLLPTLPLMIIGDILKIMVITTLLPLLQRELQQIRASLNF